MRRLGKTGRMAVFFGTHAMKIDGKGRVSMPAAFRDSLQKSGSPDAVLRKPGGLSEEEFDLIRQHPSFGSLIVGAMPGMDEVVHGVRSHHERWDGGGYPDGLAGEQIPLLGRIMAVADAFSAMTSHRPYRRAMTEKQALAEVLSGLGTQFDPEIGALFVRLREAIPAPQPAASKRRAAESREPVVAAA